MKTYFDLLVCIREATAAPVAPMPVGKRSWSQLRQEVGRKPLYSDIGHLPVERKHYSIYGIKKPAPFELWYTDDGSTIIRKKAPRSKKEVFMIHGRAGTRSNLGDFDMVGMGGEKSRYKGRIDHERKAISVVLGDGVNYDSILRLRALDKGILNIVRKFKQLYPDYAVHYWDSESKVQSA